MFPLYLAGLAIAGRTLLSKYNVPSKNSKKQYKPKKHPINKFRFQRSSVSAPNPLMTLFNNLRSTIDKGFRKAEKVDYNSVIKRFLPPGAVFTTPEFPSGAKQYQLVDLDGDSRYEIITSYKQGEELTTMVLKQESENWNKVADVTHPGYGVLHYRSVASLSNEGEKQLLIGLTGNGKTPAIYAYSFKNNSIETLFDRNYHRLELIDKGLTRNKSVYQNLAVWERYDADSYNIEVLRLNDRGVEVITDTDSYYSSNVIPYFIRRIRQSPNNAANWYNLANSLVKVKSYRDARVAVDVGSGFDVNSAFKERFEALRSKINY